LIPENKVDIKYTDTKLVRISEITFNIRIIVRKYYASSQAMTATSLKVYEF
jgi:hypothetical protein